MKIVALHTDFRIYWPARLEALSRYLSQHEFHLDVIEIAGKGSPYSFDENKKNENCSWRILFPDSKPEELTGKIIKPKLFGALDDINPDIILAGAIAFPSGALAVQWANSRPNKRVIIFDDSKIESVQRSKIVNFIKKSVYNGVDAMLYPAEPWIKTGEFWGFSKKQIFFGVDVVDNSFWSHSAQTNMFDSKYFVAAGRQITQKNFYSIIKAYHIYLQKINISEAYKLVLIGNGPEHDKIMKYINNNNLNKMIVCLDFVSQDQLRDIYHNADVLCLASTNETWGLVINEAMNAGCAIIASKECGATEVLVHHEKNGYIVSSDNVLEIAEAMLAYHKLTFAEKQLMSQKSKNIISDWGLEKFCNGAMEAIQFVVENPRTNTSLLSKIIINNWVGKYNPI